MSCPNRRDPSYDYCYQHRPGLVVKDGGPATCLICSEEWDAIHRLQHSPCCGSRRVHPGEVPLGLRPRHPKLAPITGDVFRWRGRRCQVVGVDLAGVRLDVGKFCTWAGWMRDARILQRGDA